MSEITRIIVPAEFPNDESAYITALYCESGEQVEEGAELLSIEFSKAVLEVASPATGYVCLLCVEQEEVTVGDTVAILFTTQGESLSNVTGAKSESSESPSTEQSLPMVLEKPIEGLSAHKDNPTPELVPLAEGAELIFSRKAQALVDEHSIDAAVFAGLAFVRTKDVLAFIEGVRIKKQIASRMKRDKPEDLPAKISSEILAIGKTAEIRNLLQGQNQITSNFQKRIRSHAGPIGSGAAFGSLGTIPVILKACCVLLKKFKELNGYFYNNELHFYEDVNLGYAVDLGKGLQVVNLDDLCEASETEISRKIVSGVKAYMTGQIDPQDMEKVTFVVTDLSNEGVDFFTPLLGRGQSGTLGICSTDEVLGAFNVSLTFDHRVTEGRLAATFLRELAAAVEQTLTQ